MRRSIVARRPFAAPGSRRDGAELALGGLDPGRPLDAVGHAAAARRHAAADVDGAVALERERLEPVGARDQRLRRDPALADPLQREAEVGLAVAEVLVPALLRRIRRAGAERVLGHDVLGGLGDQLLDLVRSEVVAALEAVGGDQPGGARGLARGGRAGDGRHHDVAVAAVLGRARVAEPRGDRRAGRDPEVAEECSDLGVALPQPLHVGDGAGDHHRLVVGGREVVVGGVEVGGDDRHEDAAGVRVARRGAGEARVGQAAERRLDDADPVVGRVGDAERELVRVGDERVPDADRDDLAARAHAGAAGALVRLLPGLLGAAGAVVGGRAVARGVVGVVVVVEEVPARDVVGVAVAVGVRAVGEDRDQVGRVEDVVGLVVAGRLRHARVVRVVVDGERAVAVAVVLRAVFWLGQLAAVERDLAPQAGLAPADAGVEDRDPDVGPPGRALPGAVGADAGDLPERVAPGLEVLLLLAGGVERVLVERGVLGGVGGEPEALVLLVEDVRAVGALLVVGLAVVEVGVVRRVEPHRLVRVRARERGLRRCGHGERQRGGDRRDPPVNAHVQHGTPRARFHAGSNGGG